VQAGVQFEVTWTGPNAPRDYVTIVAAGATKWTNEPYFYTTVGSPGKLVAPVADGAYALWYVSGADDTILARLAIRVTPFEGALLAEDQVEAGTNFEVAWNGPNGPGDYVTIVAAGATKWTNEPYFYTTAGSPGTLVAPIDAGSYELWYVTGQSTSPNSRRPITITPYVVTLEAPASVSAGASFEVTWTGPDGPQDYITIVRAGSAEGAYTDYAYTTEGSPLSLTAPALPGNYEVWYASDRVAGTFKSIPIRVT
jgi:Ca-activated chloride channel family protein